jgi:N-acetylglutamate synthase-like GNAT family acetyltransferase
MQVLGDALTIRTELQPGDLEWVVRRHGELYAEEYGWNDDFRVLVQGIADAFARDFDPRFERSWIAERDGERAGCVFIVRRSDEVAKLRMLLVDPAARGSGLGQRLVEECIAFSRETGYRKITLWTNSILTAARRIYDKTGFALIESEPIEEFGQSLVSETWELEL